MGLIDIESEARSKGRPPAGWCWPQDQGYYPVDQYADPGISRKEGYRRLSPRYVLVRVVTYPYRSSRAECSKSWSDRTAIQDHLIPARLSETPLVSSCDRSDRI